MPERSAAIENDEVFSYLELAAGILFLRDAFTGKGLTTETLAIVDVSSPLDNRMILFALRMLGVHVVPVHHVSHLVELSKKTGAVLVLSEVEVKRGVRRAPPDLAVPVLLAPASLRQAMRRPRDPSADPILLTGCHSIFSSGTTGRSKRVACDSASENGILAHRAEHLAFSTETVANFGAMGPWGVGAFRVPNAVWHVGGTTVFDNRRGQRPDLHAHGVTHFFTVPTALAQVAQDWPEDLPRADHVTVLAAGSPVSVPVVKAVTARMTNRIVNLCGCSETPRLPMIRAFDGDPDELNWLDLLPGTTTEIMREDGTPCAVGEIGILRYLQEADAIEGYEDDPEATAHHFRDGAFYPGDLAVRRADGRVRFAGREDDVLNIKGIKIPAGPIETRLIGELGVDGVCIFVGFDDSGAEILVVCIEGEEPVSKDALRAAAQHLAKQGKVAFSMHPRFPRGANGMGKVVRRHLRAEVFERLGVREQGGAKL